MKKVIGWLFYILGIGAFLSMCGTISGTIPKSESHEGFGFVLYGICLILIGLWLLNKK